MLQPVSRKPMLITSSTLNHDIRVVALVFVRIRQVLSLTAAGWASQAAVNSSTEKVQTPPADGNTWPRDRTMWVSRILQEGSRREKR